jgi:metal-responsive CopG/Arc/MetJ family transcriptional regulator
MLKSMQDMSQTQSRTTVTLPTDLLSAADRLIRDGKARSRNDLIISALRAELLRREREAVDADFALMAQDPAYQSETTRIFKEFVSADPEAWLGLGDHQ